MLTMQTLVSQCMCMYWCISLATQYQEPFLVFHASITQTKNEPCLFCRESKACIFWGWASCRWLGIASIA